MSCGRSMGLTRCSLKPASWLRRLSSFLVQSREWSNGEINQAFAEDVGVGEAELKNLANEHLTLVLNLGVVQLPGLKPTTESEAKKLNIVRSLRARSDSGGFLVE
jgi:hypothetical protein